MDNHVTYHCNDEAKSLEQINELTLVTRFRATEQARPLDSLDLLRMAQLVQLLSSVGLTRQILIRTEGTSITTNRLRSALVITSDTNNADSSSPALRDSVLDSWARRVERTDQRHESEVLLEAGVVLGAV